MSNIQQSILDAIGHTPLVELHRLTRGLKVRILVKVEALNPGGSIKDRVAVKMVEAAEREGRLRPGGTLIEATAGNTGLGLALVAAVKGYRAIFVLPDKMSEDKVNLLRAYGAEVVVTPSAVPPDSPESYNGVADRLAREIPGAFRPDQFANPGNPLAHYLTTGPEIWDDTGGQVDVLVAGMGTAGTISGTGRFLKERKPSVVVVGADPEGSIYSGDAPRPFKVEGIGEDFIPRTFDRQVVDEMVRVSDRDSFAAARRLAREEGILAGGSSGTALAAALRYAQRLEGPATVVAILPDTGRNYISKVYSDRWLQDNGLWVGAPPEPRDLAGLVAARAGAPPIVAVGPGDTLAKALDQMHLYHISQLPVLDGDRPVGSLQETTLLQLVRAGVDLAGQTVGAAMGRPFPAVDLGTDVGEACRLLLAGHNAVLATSGGVPRSVVTRIDLIDYLSRRLP